MENLDWLKAFDKKELEQFLTELIGVIASNKSGSGLLGLFTDNPISQLNAIVHEWHESALAIDNPKLAQAFKESGPEVPLTEPPIQKETP
jgi:hypothetical protein